MTYGVFLMSCTNNVKQFFLFLVSLSDKIGIDMFRLSISLYTADLFRGDLIVGGCRAKIRDVLTAINHPRQLSEYGRYIERHPNVFCAQSNPFPLYLHKKIGII